MSCDKPTADCTNVSPCGNTGCAEEVAAPTLPRCQDVALPAGVFTRATVTVNAAGCISAVASGTPELYTPDECCPSTGGAGDGSIGARGPQGDPGVAATITVDPVINVGPVGTGWTVVNNGTVAAAVFKFTRPADDTTNDFPTFGLSGNVGGAATGLVVQQGLVTKLPASIVTGIDLVKAGTRANDFVFTVAPTSPATPNRWTITLAIDNVFGATGADVQALTQRIQDLENTIAATPTSAYAVASITGVNVVDPVGGVHSASKVQGSANTWQFPISLAGQSVVASAGGAVMIGIDGRAVMAATTYPIGIA